MVGLVLVSHSRALADALRAMALQVAAAGSSQPLPVAVAAGAGEDGAELGTDATAILAAVEEVMSPEGVLVLLDLGSAVLSAELALDLLDETLRPRVALSAAPLVEGALAAAAQIGIGANLDAVRAEAEGALRPKREHLAASVDAATDDSSPPPAPAAMVATDRPLPNAVATWRVDNAHGLHARPAARIVQALAPFADTTVVEIENLRTAGTCAAPASARSLVALSCLDVRAGDTVRVSARGPDADAALRAFGALHADHFGEEALSSSDDEVTSPLPAEAADAPPSPSAGTTVVVGDNDDGTPVLRGVPLSPGVALGPVCFPVAAAPELPVPAHPPVPATETARLRDALAAVRQDLAENAAALTERLGRENAAILETHALLATDPGLLARAVAGIERDALDAARAWQRACREAADAYRGLANPLLRERARDVEDLAGRVLRELGVVGMAAGLRLPEDNKPCVLAIPALLPSEVAALRPGQVLGVIAESLGPTSHAAVLLRAAGVPVVDGVAPGQLRAVGLADGVEVALDGGTGEVWTRPDDGVKRRVVAASETARQRGGGRRADEEATVTAPPSPGVFPPTRTRDGRRIELAANVGTVTDAERAARAGVEAIGLVRTEFLYLDRAVAPTEDEQTDALRAIADALPPGAPVTVRTLDVGGDKPLPYLAAGAPEANPFLGVRGLRLTLRRRELFLTQLRAILRATVAAAKAGEGEKRNPFRIMFPMVTDVDEIRRARALAAEAHEELARAGVPHVWPVETGMMVEVPAAALNARALAAEVDFFSVGTNDLTQYTLAAERNHPTLAAMTASFADALHPAVLRLVATVVRAAERVGAGGKWVGVCGEAAADPLAAQVFLGLGVRELSVGPAAVAATRRLVGETDFSAARALARRALLAPSAEAVRAFGR